MIELLRRSLRRFRNAAESSFIAAGTARSRHYAPLTLSQRP
jgi:hypothetical protein